MVCSPADSGEMSVPSSNPLIDARVIFAIPAKAGIKKFSEKALS
jgi:hypothetical protein